MVAAALGGALLFVSIIMFVVVAVGTRLQDVQAADPVQFEFVPVDAEAGAMPTPPVFDRLGRWAIGALALAVVAYSGPLHDYFSQAHYLAPGMRTW